MKGWHLLGGNPGFGRFGSRRRWRGNEAVRKLVAPPVPSVSNASGTRSRLIEYLSGVGECIGDSALVETLEMELAIFREPKI